MAQGVHQITADFEAALCKYTGAKYAVAVDNQSNALFLALYYCLYVDENWWSWDWDGEHLIIPTNTYPSVPCEILHTHKKVKFDNEYADVQDGFLKGDYRIYPTNVWDSALRFTAGMYVKGQHQCLSFTGPYKHLKLGKGGAILTDNENAYKWFKKARFSGREECSYHDDNFDINPVIGWNFYMMPEIAARGLLLMTQFYNLDGTPKSNPDLALPYPDLSKFKIYQK